MWCLSPEQSPIGIYFYSHLILSAFPWTVSFCVVQTVRQRPLCWSVCEHSTTLGISTCFFHENLHSLYCLNCISNAFSLILLSPLPLISFSIIQLLSFSFVYAIFSFPLSQKTVQCEKRIRVEMRRTWVVILALSFYGKMRS